MKRSELRRKTPLKSGKALERTVAWGVPATARSTLHQGQAERAHKSKPRPRVQPAVPTRVLIALTVRSGGFCEMSLPGCARVATDPAHRAARGMGGRKGVAKELHDRLSNLTHACRFCHSVATAEPAWAYRVGLALPMGANPLAEPCLYRGVRSWLTDDGLVLTTDPNAEEAAA